MNKLFLAVTMTGVMVTSVAALSQQPGRSSFRREGAVGEPEGGRPEREADNRKRSMDGKVTRLDQWPAWWRSGN